MGLENRAEAAIKEMRRVALEHPETRDFMRQLLEALDTRMHQLQEAITDAEFVLAAIQREEEGKQ